MLKYSSFNRNFLLQSIVIDKSISSYFADCLFFIKNIFLGLFLIYGKRQKYGNFKHCLLRLAKDMPAFIASGCFQIGGLRY